MNNNYQARILQIAELWIYNNRAIYDEVRRISLESSDEFEAGSLIREYIFNHIDSVSDLLSTNGIYGMISDMIGSIKECLDYRELVRIASDIRSDECVREVKHEEV